MSSTEVLVVVCGGGGCGKSALVAVFSGEPFPDHYDPTIEDSYRITKEIDGKDILLDVLDTAGQEEYSAMRDQYIRTGFDTVASHYLQWRIIKKDKPLHIVLVGNKSDMKHQAQVSQQDIDELANELSCTYIETSAKEDINVQEIFNTAAKLVLEERENNITPKPKKKELCFLM